MCLYSETENKVEIRNYLPKKKVSIIAEKEKGKQREFLSSYEELASNGEPNKGLIKV